MPEYTLFGMLSISMSAGNMHCVPSQPQHPIVTHPGASQAHWSSFQDFRFRDTRQMACRVTVQEECGFEAV